MTKLADKLSTLNALRAVAGKAPLSNWKNSMAELDRRIEELSPTQHIVHATGQVSPDLAGAIAASTVTATKVPATAPELTVPARRRAIVKQIADKSVKADKPTTTIDAKAASRQLRKAGKKTAPKVTAKSTTKPAAKKTAPATNDFAKYLASINMTGKVARAKLRRAKIAKVNGRYEVTVELKKALSTDARKK